MVPRRHSYKHTRGLLPRWWQSTLAVDPSFLRHDPEPILVMIASSPAVLADTSPQDPQIAAIACGARLFVRPRADAYHPPTGANSGALTTLRSPLSNADQAATGSGSRSYSRSRPPNLARHRTAPDGLTGSERAIGVRSSIPRCGRARL